MPETIRRVMIQMRSNPALAAASFGPFSVAPLVPGMANLPGIQFDASFSPVPLPPRLTSNLEGATNFNIFSSVSEPTTYIIRGQVQEDNMSNFLEAAGTNPNIVGVFADPLIQPITVCPNGPIGSDLDVEQLLFIDELKQRGMDGAGVKVVVVDTGINMAHLRFRGKNPRFDTSLSWGPVDGLQLGNMPVDHGTMCAYDICIAAPACTLIDHPVLASQAPGGSVMEGLLSDAVRSYGILLSYLTKAPLPFAGDHTPRTLVVNNSWGMFHPSWDFPVGDPQNYSDNLGHPFNIIVSSLEAAGADILFAAGNCGTECPDGRCQGVTNAGIFGANSSSSVTCVAGVVLNKDRIGYSTKGPGRLEKKKPDIASFTHFAGSGVYEADGGTSAATPVAAGVVAAIRRLYPASILPPAKLRDFLRNTADSKNGKFTNEYGFGVINVNKLLKALDNWAEEQGFISSSTKSKNGSSRKKKISKAV